MEKGTIRISLVGLALDWDMFDTKLQPPNGVSVLAFCFVCTGEMKIPHELCLSCGTHDHMTCHLRGAVLILDQQEGYDVPLPSLSQLFLFSSLLCSLATETANAKGQMQISA